MMRRNPIVRLGFTLVEVLIATSLVAVVLALALRGFTEAKKITDLTRSKVLAADEATLGVEKLAKIIRRCHIIFFDARPLPNHTDTAAAQAFYSGKNNANGESTMDLGDVSTIPATLRTAPDGGNIQVRWVRGAAPFPNGGSPITANRDDFRFMTGTVSGLRLAAAYAAADALDPKKPTTTLNGMNGYFPPVLFYGAEATFNNSNTAAANTQVDPSLPMTWTFYVFYLVPMTFDVTRDVGHALFPLNQGTGLNVERDMGRNPTTNAPFRRTTMPYEIRLLTIPDVLAIQEDTSKGSANAEFQKFGRVLQDDGDTTKVIPMPVRPFPHDVPPGKVNYDPQPLSMDNTGDLDTTINGYSAPKAGSGARVNGLKHGNFANIGNDPPAEACFDAGQRREWLGVANPAAPGAAFAGAGRDITDTVIARYIDPDAPNGTCVRLAVDDTWRGIDHLGTPYVNAYNGPQMNRHMLLPGPAAGELRSPPKRCMISVATRFRTTSNIPFQFSTESVEVDLEALARYQAHDRRQN